jgi:hypothetical protein
MFGVGVTIGVVIDGSSDGVGVGGGDGEGEQPTIKTKKITETIKIFLKIIPPLRKS